jgi:hypothetical protein
MKDHVYMCGSRTDLCEVCGERVLLRGFKDIYSDLLCDSDMEIHLASNCGQFFSKKKNEVQRTNGNAVDNVWTHALSF